MILIKLINFLIQGYPSSFSTVSTTCSYSVAPVQTGNQSAEMLKNI